MNQTSATSSSGATSQSGASLLPDGIDALTTVHFVILALIAIGVVAMIVAGVRRSRIRHQAAREMAEHAAQAGVTAEAPQRSDDVPPAPPRTDEPEPVATPEPTRLDDEPIAAAAPMEASPASEASPESAAPVAASADQPVTLLKGLGPKVSAALADRGITTVGQLAALDDARADALDADLGPFRGRMARDRWIEQARFLAAGDRAGFEAVFGKL